MCKLNNKMLLHILFVSSVFFGAGYAQSWINLPGSLYGPAEAPWSTSNIARTWPLTNIGQPLQPQTPDKETLAMIAEVDPHRIESIITTLANFGTRHTLSSQTDPKRGIGAARDWILKEMQSFAAPSKGNMKVYLNSYIQPVAERISFPVNISNVVAEIKGTTDPNRVYVVTGHYDSRRIDIMDYTGDAPGADDDASGVAGKSFLFHFLFIHLRYSFPVMTADFLMESPWNWPGFVPQRDQQQP
jgi:hypothetical protein